MTLNFVTGYWYPNRSTEILFHPKPIPNANMLVEDILKELNEVHPFKKDPFLIGKVKNYFYTKKYYAFRPKNQMSGLFYQNTRKSTETNLLLQQNIFDLGEEDFYCSSRGIKASANIRDVPSQECYVFGRQAIINSVGEQLLRKNHLLNQKSKSLETSEETGKSHQETQNGGNKNKGNVDNKSTNNINVTNKVTTLQKSGIDGSWTLEDARSKVGKRCCEAKPTKGEGKDKKDVDTKCSSLKPRKLLGLGEKSDEYSYPICPHGTAAIILKTYSTYNIKFQFRAKYVTLGVQKKRKRRTKWRARQWAWFMKKRSLKIEKKIFYIICIC